MMATRWVEMVVHQLAKQSSLAMTAPLRDSPVRRNAEMAFLKELMIITILMGPKMKLAMMATDTIMMVALQLAK